MRYRVWLIGLLTGLCLAAAPQETGQLSVDSLFHPARKVAYLEPAPAALRWCQDGSLLVEWADRDQGLARLAGPDWEPRPLLSRAQFTAALAAAGLEDPEAAAGAWRGPFVWNGAGDAFLAANGQDLYLVDLAARVGARRVPGAAGVRELPGFSPDGSQLAYLRDNDLYVAELATGRETRLTNGGDEDHLNGRLDWLYQEEIFSGEGPRAFWWSPDSKRIAFLSLDDSQVPSWTVADDRGPERKASYHYPLAGQPNPAARLGVADLDGHVAWMEDPYPDQDTLIVQVGWDPKGRLLASYQDRAQTWLECVRFEGAKPQRLVREAGRGAWVDRLPLPLFLADGGFLWRSARSGFNHLYRYDADGRLRSAITAGPWDVRALHGVDDKAGKVYFSATRSNPIGLDAYSVDLDGPEPNQNIARLTERPGTHTVAFNAAFNVAVDRFSDLDTPPRHLLLNTEGRVLREIEGRTSPAFQAVRRGRTSFQQVMTRDGVALETLLVFPPGFDPSRKYPVFHCVYGGPGTPLVRNAFSPEILWYQFLAQHGIVTWVCDNRSASGKGVSAQGVYRNLGAQELRDQLDGLAWLKAQGWADLNRVALCGHSYGGFLAAYALTHSKAWKLGIIGAPVVDWRLYDSVYTERLMGLPEDNPDGYAAASPLRAAADLSGKLLLIHGTLDRNVHLQNTVQFIDALQRTGHSAPLILLPGAGHTPRAPRHAWAVHQAIWEFLQENLWN